MRSYEDFLREKIRSAPPIGRDADPSEVHPMLHPWQREIVAWAVRRGRAALWEDTGLGKSFQQIQWAVMSGDRSLIAAPLAVCHQTVREAAKLGVEARYARSDDEATGPGLWVTNYERVHNFDPAALDAFVLDESSILKQADGKMRTALIAHCREIKRRLECSATPAPNDNEELTSQAEWLGVIPRSEMLATYFVHDDDGWRVKGHARRPMFRWMASWAVALRRPSDIGGDDAGYILPGYDLVPHLLPVDVVPGEPWIIWCGLNAEADLLAKLIPGAVNVHGSMTPEEKAEALLGFADGQIRTIITKTSIASFGMNWQHCARMAFCGLNDSFESMYQAIRRCHRYGQSRRVQVHVVLSELEGQIAENVRRKERQVTAMTEELVDEMRNAGELRIR
jgi:hypothetical protein